MFKEKTPADKVIEAFASLAPAKSPFDVGLTTTAKLLGRHVSAVSRWREPIHKGGTGGRVPPKLHGLILRLAKEKGLKLSAEDLIV